MTGQATAYRIQCNAGELLGKGSYGAVFRGTLDGHIRVAVKRVDQHEVGNISREETALFSLNHPHIIKLLASESHEDSFRYFALELCAASLDQAFLKDGHPQKYRGPLPESKLTALLQLAEGLAHIHANDLVHRDIKPANVLISSTTPVVLKWADFGLSRPVNARGTFTMSGVKGTAYWMAPENLQLISNSDEGQSFALYNQVDGKPPRGTVKSDVFSAGCVFCYFLMDGEHPFGIGYKIPVNIMEGNPYNLWKSRAELIDRPFIEKMLARDPGDRITSHRVVELIQHHVKERELLQLCAKNNPNETDVTRLTALLEHEAVDVNCLEHELRLTPLLAVCRSSKTDRFLRRYLRILFRLGGDRLNTDSCDREGMNALQLFISTSRQPNLLQSVRLLVKRGRIDVHHRSRNGSTALLLLFSRQYGAVDLVAVARFLIEKRNADVNAQDDEGWNALHLACRYCSGGNLIDSVRLLIDNSVDVSRRNGEGHTALRILLGRNDAQGEAVQMLLYSRAEMDDAQQVYRETGWQRDASVVSDDEETSSNHSEGSKDNPVIGTVFRIGLETIPANRSLLSINTNFFNLLFGDHPKKETTTCNFDSDEIECSSVEAFKKIINYIRI